MMRILSDYEKALGQKINPDKSSVFFSPNTPSATNGEILNILGLMHDSRHKKYLGLPSLIGKSKSQVFAEIKEKVRKNWWGGRRSFFSLKVGKSLSKP